MKVAQTYVSEDGRKFDSEQACREHEQARGFAGPVKEYLDTQNFESERARSMQRNAIAGYVAWQAERANPLPLDPTIGANQVTRAVDPAEPSMVNPEDFIE